MDSKKMKEIKKVLEEGQFNTIKHHQHEGNPILISFADILTLINELESELAELETKIENGTLIDTTTIRYEKEEDKDRYEIYTLFPIKEVIDFADTEAEAEQRIKESQRETE